MNKQYLMLSAAMLLTGAAHAQGTELFFSEYDEGAHMKRRELRRYRPRPAASGPLKYSTHHYRC